MALTPTYTSRTRALKQATGSNTDAWGTEQNTGTLDIMDQAWGTVSVAVNADVTLTSQNGLQDQARSLVLVLTGTGGFTVTHPAVDKPYLVVNNCTADVTMKPQAGTGSVVRAGMALWYIVTPDGLTGISFDRRISDFLAANKNIDMGGFAIKNIAAGVDPTDVATLQQLQPFATAAANSATAAAASASSALSYKNSTVTLYTDFISRYLGAFANDPTTDPLGNSLIVGALYFNTTANALRIWNGSNWLVAAATIVIASQAQAVAGTDNTTMMTPLRTQQSIAALAGGYQEFLSNGTWTNPPNARWVYVELLGGGGGGGSGAVSAASVAGPGGGGGGGSAFFYKWFNASDLTSTVPITVGAAGAGGAVASVAGGPGSAGGTGGTSAFGSYVSQAGGVGGGAGSTASGALGGNGSGWLGLIALTGTPNGIAFEGAFANNATARNAVFGGATGTGNSGSTNQTNAFGGSSVVGGGGGGVGGTLSNDNSTFYQPTAGGTTNSYTAGGGASAGTSAASNTAGASGTSMGVAGGGGGASFTASGKAGGAGGIAAGGGGGGGCRNGFTSGAGGNGGPGRVRVWWGY